MKSWCLPLLICLLTACGDENNKQQDIPVTDSLPPAVLQLYRDIEKNPDSTGLRMQLADALDSIGDYEKALAQMDVLVGSDSANFDLWYRKAQLQQNAKDTVAALLSYRVAAGIYPSPDALLAMANLYAEQRSPEAIALCRQVDQLKLGSAYDAHTAFISGVYYARTGNRQKALERFNRCIGSDYMYMEAYMEKGFIYYDDKNLEAAISTFETAAQVRQTYADAYYWLAKCRELTREKEKAIFHYRQALALDPGITAAADALKKLEEQ